jgi:serine/threonine protein kinase HipA of HipAB toxin-antitoxin module
MHYAARTPERLGPSRRRVFFKTTMLFRMLCAIDGHAKNFSLFLGPGDGETLRL